MHHSNALEPVLVANMRCFGFGSTSSWAGAAGVAAVAAAAGAAAAASAIGIQAGLLLRFGTALYGAGAPNPSDLETSSPMAAPSGPMFSREFDEVRRGCSAAGVPC